MTEYNILDILISRFKRRFPPLYYYSSVFKREDESLSNHKLFFLLASKKTIRKLYKNELHIIGWIFLKLSKQKVLNPYYELSNGVVDK